MAPPTNVLIPLGDGIDLATALKRLKKQMGDTGTFAAMRRHNSAMSNGARRRLKRLEAAHQKRRRAARSRARRLAAE